jgi:tRNA-Thr(GGU) m(6)t(6)A37 methyltransferase TsaA
MKEMVVKPIGIVKNEVKGPMRGGWEEVASEIVVEGSLLECLEGVEEFSHIIVVYWMHRVPSMERPPGKIHPQGRADLPLVGIFATRAPYRPNPLGVSMVRLVERKGNILKVMGLDAIDGTPVLDIKPYLPPLDTPLNVQVPEWVKRLRGAK